MDAADVLAGRYRLVERLGEGGMSVVWRAHDQVLDRQVAVKLLSPRLVADQDSRLRIRAEAQAVAKLSHPNIAGVYDYGEHDDGVPYIVMELLNGQTLAERLEAGPLPITDVLRICAQVATALGEAHEHGIVHRDVKPANVMVTANGTAKVVDFGVAAPVGDLTERDAVLFGTPAYVAPERLSGGAVVAATDIYGLGVLLYRMLTGYMPWSADSTTQMLVAHMYVEPEPLPPLTGLPAAVVEVCQACLAKEPEDRPAASVVAEILSGGSTSVIGKSAAPVRKYPLAAKRRQRRRLFAVAGAAAAAISVLTAAVVAAAVVSPSDETSPNRDNDSAVAQPAASIGVGGASGGTGPTTSASPGSTRTNPGGGPYYPNQPGMSDPVLPSTNAPTPPKIDGTTDPPEPIVASQTSYGNTVTVQCTGTTAQIIGTAEAEGYSVTRISPGPADQVNVRFESATLIPALVTFKCRCSGGVPKFNPGTG